GNADRPRLVRDRAGDGLANPPRGVGGKLVAAAILELVAGFHQADVALLDQVQELQATVRIFLGDRDHEPQVRLYHFLFRTPRLCFADRHLAIDLLDLRDLQVCQRLDRQQLALRAQHVVLKLGQGRGVLALGTDMLLDPVEIGFALGEAREKVLLRHARIPHADLHDLPLLRANDGHGRTQVTDQRVRQFRGQSQLHQLVGKFATYLHGALVLAAVLFERSKRALVEPANVLDALGNFLRIRAGIDNFLFGVVVIIIAVGFRDWRLDFIRRIRIDEADHEVLHPRVACRDRVIDFQHPLEGRREVRHVILDLVKPVFDALRDLDFTLPGQQLYRAHLPHVHANRVGGAAEFRIDAGERSFGFFRCVVVVARYGRIRQQQRLGIRRLLVHRDPHVVNHVYDVFDLFRIDDSAWQVIIDFSIGQVTLLLAAGNQIF